MFEEYFNVWEEESQKLLNIAKDLKGVVNNSDAMLDVLNEVLTIETKIFRARIKCERAINLRRF